MYIGFCFFECFSLCFNQIFRFEVVKFEFSRFLAIGFVRAGESFGRFRVLEWTSTGPYVTAHSKRGDGQSPPKICEAKL